MISIGTGSAMNVVDMMIQENQELKVAIVDKDAPGGICLTRGCIPSKILLYPADLVRMVGRVHEFGIQVEISRIDFAGVMERMRGLIGKEIELIRQGLAQSRSIDYYTSVAEFIAPYTLKVGDTTIRSRIILLCTGSRPSIPAIKGLDKISYHTSDTILKMTQLPGRIAIVGGGYIAAEYGHFFSAMGSEVTIIGRNSQFLPDEEPEVSLLAKKELGQHMTILTGHEVVQVEEESEVKKIGMVNRSDGKTQIIETDEVLIATGRSSNTDLLHPEKGGVKIDGAGWILADEYLETSQANIWAFGDANGRFPFKHKANYESLIVYHNAVLKKKIKADYHAVPHAVFTHPEIASVGFRESEVIERYGEDDVLIGIQRYQDTAKGEAMGLKDFFAKVIVKKEGMKILGAHIIGPEASLLIQEIVDSMYAPVQDIQPIVQGMHIHPALSEVVERAFNSLMPPAQYHHLIEHHRGLPGEQVDGEHEQ